MRTTEPLGPSNAELLQRLDLMQAAMDWQHAEMLGEKLAMQKQHIALQEKVKALESRKLEGSSAFPGPTLRSQAGMRAQFSHRTSRIGVGVALAALLLTAPWESGVSHAAGTNTFYGDGALTSNTAGTYNSAFGNNALTANSIGLRNTATGADSLKSNTSGEYNTASGAEALTFNDTGTNNTATGEGALFDNTDGSYNTASGTRALYSNVAGRNNTASGADSMYYNTTGNYNTATGYDSLYSSTTGAFNTATGFASLISNSTGAYNTAAGHAALAGTTTGDYNTAIGELAGYTATAANANTTGSNNTFIGFNSGPGTPTQLTNATAIGANAHVSQDNSIVLGGTGANTQKVGVGTETPHSALQIAKGFLQLRPITGTPPAPEQCVTSDDAGRLVVRTDGSINLYVCNGTNWIGK